MKKKEKLMIGMETQEGDHCPECLTNWDGGDVYEYFLEARFNPNHEQHASYRSKTLKELIAIANSYGWDGVNKTRLSKLIGIDCSMDIDADKEDQYDGISYWQCPKCQIAWHRLSGVRTDKFVKKEAPKQIIYNAIQTPDGTIISSDYRHDYVTHVDKNGKTYGVDGGNSYLRRIGDMVDCKDLSVYLEDWTPRFHVKAREVVKRGGRGKCGTEPLTWVPICEMNDNWVKATIEYNNERGLDIGNSWFTNLLRQELHYRNSNGISIKEEENT